MENVKTNLNFMEDMGHSSLTLNLKGELAFCSAFCEYHERLDVAGLKTAAEKQWAKDKEEIIKPSGGGFDMQTRANQHQTRLQAFECVCEYLRENFTEDKYPCVSNLTDEQIFNHLKKSGAVPEEFSYNAAYSREDLIDWFTVSKMDRVFELTKLINNYDGCNTLASGKIKFVDDEDKAKGYSGFKSELSGEYVEEMFLNKALLEDPAKILYSVFHEYTYKHEFDSINSNKKTIYEDVYVRNEFFDLTLKFKHNNNGYIEKEKTGNADFEHRLQPMERFANLNAERLCAYAAIVTNNTAFEKEIKRQAKQTEQALFDLKNSGYIEKLGAKTMDEALAKKSAAVAAEKKPVEKQTNFKFNLKN